MSYQNKLRKGFTLLEILIVIAIIGTLSAYTLMNIFGQLKRGNDAKRKMDLNTLSKFFENYYNDHGEFPKESDVNNCNSSFESYILSIPCDPASKEPYGYFPIPNGGGYRICAKLADKTDISIAGMNCAGVMGCGVGCGYNFCLASGVSASAVGTGDEVSCTGG